MKGKKNKIPGAGFLNGALPGQRPRDGGGKLCGGSDSIASLASFCRSEVSPLYRVIRVIDCFVRKWGTRASHILYFSFTF